jgi:hypothetical protein
VEEKGQQQQTILHELDLMDKNFEAVCKVAYDIDIIVIDPEDIKHNPRVAVEPAPESKGTPSKPILIDEDPKEKEDTQQWKRGYVSSWARNTCSLLVTLQMRTRLPLLVFSIIFYVVFSRHLGHVTARDLDVKNSSLQSCKIKIDILTYCGLGFPRGKSQLTLIVFYFLLY